MYSTTKRPPYLEILSTSSNAGTITESFDHIKSISICWVAHEILEAEYEPTLSEKGIDIGIQRSCIVFTDNRTHELLAKIHFDKSLNVIDSVAESAVPA